MSSTKTPGRVIRATVVRAAQASVSRVVVRAEVDDGLAKAASAAHAAVVAVDDGWVDVKHPPAGILVSSISHGIKASVQPPVQRFLLEEMVVVVEVFVIDFDKQLADDVVVDDTLALAFGFNRVFFDNAGPIDGFTFDYSKSVTDTVSAVDSLTTFLTKGLVLADSVTPIDVMVAVLGGKPELNEQEINVGELN
jgi:hypothetical protein